MRRKTMESRPSVLPLVLAATAAGLLSCSAILGIDDRPPKPTPGAAGQGGAGGAGGVGGAGLPLGEACLEPEQCASGACVDDVCCEHLCGECQRCDSPNGLGSCTLISPGTPDAPECADGVCDGNGHCATGEISWARSFGGDFIDWGSQVLVQDDGSVILAGHFEGTITFGSNTLTSLGAMDVFVAKLDPSGTPVWSHRFGGGSHDTARDAALGPNGQIVVVGYVGSAVDFGGGELPYGGGRDAFVLVLEADGSHHASRTYGADGNQVVYAVAVESDGGLALAGVASGPVDFGGDTLTPAPFVNAHQYFVVRLDGQYQHHASQLLNVGVLPTNEGPPTPLLGISLDQEGNAILGGNFVSVAAFGNTEHVAVGGADGFVVKMDPDGAALWSASFGGSDDDGATRTAVDGDGRVFVAGLTVGAVDFDALQLQGGGSQDGVLGCFDSAGTLLWATILGINAAEQVHGLGVDAAGNVVVAGLYTGFQTNLGGENLPSGDGTEVFVAKLAAGAAQSTHLWSHGFVGSGDSVARGLGVGADGHVAVTGEYSGRLDIGTVNMDTQDDANTDIFAALLVP